MSDELDITIVTGLSGAGRSEAANVLEDLGFFVIDNLPPLLIPKVAELARAPGRPPTRYALGADIRSGALEDLHVALEQLREHYPPTWDSPQPAARAAERVFSDSKRALAHLH